MGYYAGDFYAGDPGFFSFLGKVAKTAVGFIPGVGKVASNVIGALEKKAPGIVKVGKAVAKHPVLSAAGAAGAIGAGGAALGRMGGTPAAAGRAHMARMPRAAGMGGHRRRMNVCNPKALRRAIRRTHGFAKLAMKTIHLTHPKKHVTFGGFKKRRKR